YQQYRINLLHKKNAGRIPMVIQQEDLIRLIVINAEVNARCVMVCETPEQVAERINVPVNFVNA
ncbi:MAG: hypothetical protein MSH22_12465, partial [Spirochaetia bacterium]|nr:hypothetical protein [Spirochaetia bacterium]